MDTLVLTGIGLAALGYVVYVIWRSVNGNAGCNCGSSGSCPGAGCCNAKPAAKQKSV